MAFTLQIAHDALLLRQGFYQVLTGSAFPVFVASFATAGRSALSRTMPTSNPIPTSGCVVPCRSHRGLVKEVEPADHLDSRIRGLRNTERIWVL